MTSLWMPEAVRYPGNPAVTGYPSAGRTGPKRGDVKHSAEGTNWGVIHDLLQVKSWHFTIGYDRIEQHHPIDVNCWHAADSDDDGGIAANIEMVGDEHLGIAGEPLTAWQTAATVRVTRFCADVYGFTQFGRYPVQGAIMRRIWTLAEHNQVSDTYTACPSHRFDDSWPKILTALNAPQEDDMTEAQIKQLNTATLNAQIALNKLDVAAGLLAEAYKRIGATDAEVDELKRKLAEAGEG